MSPLTASPEQRQRILRVAARLTTTRTDPAAVVINAGPLLAWVESAASEDDMRSRLVALRDHSANCAMDPDETSVWPLADNPDAFLRGAKVLYAFATAGGAA